MRIDKYLAESGFGTRKEVKALLRNGAVIVDSAKIFDAGKHVDPATAKVTVHGKPVNYSHFRYYMLNKPQDVISATEDGHDRTVVELLPKEVRRDLFPVGRLDKDTTGLLLLTNDGDLAHALLSPRRHVAKTYLVETDRPIPDDAPEKFREGLIVDDEFTALPAELTVLSTTSARIVITEGKYHQVKRMFAAVGCTVTRLQRLTMGPLVLDESLAEGEWRPLRETEINELMKYKS